MHLLIWLTKSVFGNALCASIIGFLYGPIYPNLLSMATEVLPDEVHLVSMSLMYVNLFPSETGINDSFRPELRQRVPVVVRCPCFCMLRTHLIVRLQHCFHSFWEQ